MASTIRAWRVTGLVAVAALLMTACGIRARRPTSDASRGTLITAQEVEDSGARTIWEALQRTVKYTQFTQNSRGTPLRIRRRGPSTILLFEDIPIYIYNVRVRDIRVLDQIPAREIERIQVLNGIDATTYYGTNATDGVILIFTRTG